MTEQQQLAVNRLVAQGWRIDTRDDDTVYLSKRNRKQAGQTLYCQVDKEGTVN